MLVSSRAVVSKGWLSELAAVAHAEEKTACATPLSDVDCGWSGRAASDERIDEVGDDADSRIRVRRPSSLDRRDCRHRFLPSTCAGMCSTPWDCSTSA